VYVCVSVGICRRMGNSWTHAHRLRVHVFRGQFIILNINIIIKDLTHYSLSFTNPSLQQTELGSTYTHVMVFHTHNDDGLIFSRAHHNIIYTVHNVYVRISRIGCWPGAFVVWIVVQRVCMLCTRARPFVSRGDHVRIRKAVLLAWCVNKNYKLSRWNTWSTVVVIIIVPSSKATMNVIVVSWNSNFTR